MDKTGIIDKNITKNDAPEELNTPKPKAKPRGKKRKRRDSESSTDIEDILPDNALQVEQNLHASAIKNNLDDVSVKKILKKVVTNDHVLALVKLREEEEDSSAEERGLQPKLTRAKVKELMKVSPKSSRWNLENLALTPIKHIPVKTRPEVKALIAHELHEDVEDDEYEPTHEDVPSDDDQTMESCSDLDSQPRTPATPSSRAISPRVIKDGPFKVPQDITTPTRRKLVIVEEEATIALRTRSKLSLSATPIEHIESSFVPPDDIPTPRDDLWDQFLEECLNPTSVTKTEEDDEADPEYNVAADPDAHDEDEEALENSIIKISKKELNDLVTELFSIMPEDSNTDELAENLAKKVLTDTEQTDLNLNEQNKIQNHWDGKQELVSDEETEVQAKPSELKSRDRLTRISIGKSEPEDPEYRDASESATEKDKSSSKEKEKDAVQPENTVVNKPTAVSMSVVEQNFSVQPPQLKGEPPPLLRRLQGQPDRVDVYLDKPGCILPQQTMLLQQQLRQHIQLATSNFLQLYVNPTHWALAHTYKDYLNQLDKMLETNPTSVANVCNLKPAIELITSWENSVSEDTPENKKIVEFIQDQAERSRRRFQQNSLYVGDFPDQLMEVVANSNVFLYPYLLPAMPYRADPNRKFGYRRCEDNLIALGLDQFWQYVEDNPQMFKPPVRPHPRYRWGLAASASLVCKHMFPWIPPRVLLAHIHKSRKDEGNPIHAFFEKREVKYMKHNLLPFNPNLTLYEQPEYEMPRIWIRYLAKSSKRFRDHLFRRRNSGLPPQGGVSVNLENSIDVPNKNPLPIDFTKAIICNRANMHPKVIIEPFKDKYDIELEKVDGENKAAVTNTVTSELKVITGELPPGTKVLGNITAANGNFLVIGNASNAAVANATGDNAQNIPAGKLIAVGNISAGNATNANISGNNIPTGNMITVSNIGTGNANITGNGLPSNNLIHVGNMTAVNVAANANKGLNIPAGNMITVSNIGANTNVQDSALPPGKLIPVRNIASLNMPGNADGTGSSKPAGTISVLKNTPAVNILKKSRKSSKTVPAAKMIAIGKGAGKVSINNNTKSKNLPSAKTMKISEILKNNNVSLNAGNVSKTLPLGNLKPIANAATRGNVTAKNNVTTKPVGTVRGIPTVATNTTAANKVTSGNVAAGNEVTAGNLIATVNNQSQTVASNNVNDANAQNVVISSNMYRVVETSIGAYLVPITILQAPGTVNSENGIPGTVPDKTADNNVIMTHNKKRSKSIPSFDHCRCCLLIRKICKRQTVMTDFFKPKTNVVQNCECTDRRYPRISNKLRLLITNYKDHSWSVHKELQWKLDEKNRDKTNNEMEVDTQCSLEDIASVTSYQLKLTIRTSIVRNTYTKKRLNTLFSRFDPYSDDPINLSEELFKVFDVELVDLYKEFLGFLTAEQAEKIGRFKDYFVHHCVPHLIKRIEDEISDKDRRCRILSYLSGMTVDNASTSCEMSAGLIASLTDHPRLAQYVFSLFPHRITDEKKKDDRSMKHSDLHNETKVDEIEDVIVDIDGSAQSGSETENELDIEGDFEDDTLTPSNVMDYEADHSSSGEEDENRQSVTFATTDIKHEVPHTENEPITEKSVTKTEDSDDFCDSTMSTMIMSEDEPVKSEVAEWKRDEDKVILEVLLHNITPEVRKEKTILEILDEKSVYEMLGESLTHKSVNDIKDRVMYLLEILLLSEY